MCLILRPFGCAHRPVESDQTAPVRTYLVILTFERLLPTLPAFGSLFLLAQHAGFLVEAPTTNLRQHACFLHFLLETLQRTLKGLVLIHDNTRHTRPSPLASRWPKLTQRATRCSLQGLIIDAPRKMSNQVPPLSTGSAVTALPLGETPSGRVSYGSQQGTGVALVWPGLASQSDATRDCGIPVPAQTRTVSASNG
jgi:hypothetical protein